MTVKWNGDAIIAQVRAGAMRAVVRGTESVVEEATSLILETPKTGRVYRRRGVVHQASAPGQAPASDRGRLVQSGRTQYDSATLTGTATWSTGYAGHLEFGTQKMEPRPYARPALANRREEIESDIADEVKDALR
jgi:HK97 gp10 family phage protein